MASGWTKETALAELHRLVDETKKLPGERPLSERHTQWLLGSSVALKEIFGANSLYYRNFHALPWRFRGDSILVPPEDFADPEAVVARKDQDICRRSLETARGILLEAANQPTALSEAT